MRVLVATDAWHPQVNGVVRTYERLAIEAGKLGFEIVFLTPSDFRTLPCPTYPEIRLALAGPRAIAAHIAKAKPDFIHIATQDQMAVHHELSHTLPGICLGPAARPRVLVLCATTQVS